MENKVILISIDGMRPDGMQQCGNPYVKELEALCAYTYEGAAVEPSVTLPCHYSMAYSVPPARHGVTTNTYTPPVRPVLGLFEKIKAAGGVSAMFYGWEELRDIARPGSLNFSAYTHIRARESTDTALTDEALRLIESDRPDFVFLYLGDTDVKGGHACSWMSEEYLRRVSIGIDNVKRVIDAFGEEYSVILMADHGGHGRGHGTSLPEDMTVPFFFFGRSFTPGPIARSVTLLDLAPTITSLMGIVPEEEWEGKSLL